MSVFLFFWLFYVNNPFRAYVHVQDMVSLHSVVVQHITDIYAADYLPLYRRVGSVDPTVVLILKTFRRRLLVLSNRLDQWPLRAVILDSVIVDFEGVLKEMIPELRTAITRSELTESEYCRIFATGESKLVFTMHIMLNSFPVKPDNNEHMSIRDSSLAPSDTSDDILDTTNVHQWLAARPESMSRVESPPIYDSDHPEYQASSLEDETSDGESSDDSSDSEKENVPPE